MINKITNIINEEIKNHIIKEYNDNDAFLSNYDTAIKYAYDNIDDVGEAFDEYEKNPDNIQVSYARDKYIELIELYVDKYNELKNQSDVKIYRLVKLNTIDDLILDNIGMHWSFESDGVGDYGGNHPNRMVMGGGKPYVLEAIVNPYDIDWVYGFNSFIWYGEDQWECSLNKNTKVTIISINDKELKKPIVAVVSDD